jgi:Ni,Fe-hydrogenase III small subunit/formate hydrogenlyase subunit 6/NADH:ubiquinone oxidoreductase subunit I
MFDKTKKILKYPRLTQDSPKREANFDHYLGNPFIDTSACDMCGECASDCPSNAIFNDEAKGRLDIRYDQCIYCMQCVDSCRLNAINTMKRIFLAEKDKDMLRMSAYSADEKDTVEWEQLGKKLHTEIKSVFGRSLNIREVDSGSCNGCDYEINALNNPFIDVERFGVSFVASPRHADMLLVTGAAVRNMEQALLKTYNATPDPKLVVAVGACACSGGIFRDTYATRKGIEEIIPVDVYVPGCPPRPQAIVYGILKAIGRL